MYESQNKAVKSWFTLSNVTSKFSSPLKENAYKGPRALLCYFFGDKTEGVVAIKEEINNS